MDKKSNFFFCEMSKKTNCAQKMSHLGEFCAELGATIVGVGAALPRVRLTMILERAIL